MRFHRLTAFVAVVLAAGLVAAEAPESWRDYFAGPAGYLITKKERKEWKRIDSAAQAEHFINLFWAKRDPDLETSINELKEAFDLRVEAADASFSDDNQRGAMTDRGQVLILLGRPAQRLERNPESQGSAGGGIESPAFPPPGGAGGPTGEEPSPGMGTTEGAPPTSGGLTALRDRGAYEIWVYDPHSLPGDLKESQPLPVIFQERGPGSGDYRLDRSDPRNGPALRVIADAPEALLLHPDLTEIPRYGLIQGTQPATTAQLGWFASGERTLPAPARVLTEEGLVSASQHFIWTHLELASGPDKALAVGRLRDQTTGAQVGSFQLEVTALDTPEGRAYELSVPVGPGKWALDVALAEAGGDSPIAVTTVELTTTEVPLDKTVFSPFVWGAQVVQLKEPRISDPFSVGGWHVIPRSNGTYGSNESLSYMLYVLQPKLGEDRQPQLTARISLFQNGHRLVQGPPQPARLSQVQSDLWMYGSGIELDKIPSAGDYTLQVQLTQTTDGAETAVKIPFTLVKAEGGEQPAAGGVKE